MRILDLTHHIAGPFATMLLAELGHDVIKIERPHVGDPERARQASKPDGTTFDYLNRRKRSLTLDLKQKQGRELLLRLAAGADAVVENFRPGTLPRLRLSYRTLRRANPALILTSISNFGQTGPRRDWAAAEIVLEATGGVVAATGRETPLQLAGNVAQHLAGVNAAEATIAAWLGVRTGSGRDARGVHIDISIQEIFAAHWVRHISQYIHHGMEMVRGSGAVPGRQGFPDTLMAQDGLLYVLALRAEWESFAFFFGLDQFTSHEWSDAEERLRRWDEIDPYFRAAVASRSRYDWFAAGSEMHYTFAPIEDAPTLLHNPQLAARGFFHQAETSDGRSLPCAGLPFTGLPAPAAPNRPPRLGEHTEAILSSLLGLSDPEIGRLRDSGIV